MQRGRQREMKMEGEGEGEAEGEGLPVVRWDQRGMVRPPLCLGPW